MLPDPIRDVLAALAVMLGISVLLTVALPALARDMEIIIFTLDGLARVLVTVLDDLARWLVQKWRSFRDFTRNVHN